MYNKNEFRNLEAKINKNHRSGTININFQHSFLKLINMLIKVINMLITLVNMLALYLAIC